jgi:hypothetical protein
VVATERLRRDVSSVFPGLHAGLFASPSKGEMSAIFKQKRDFGAW